MVLFAFYELLAIHLSNIPLHNQIYIACIVSDTTNNINIFPLFCNAGFQVRKKLTMMVIPSIFVPEDWSFTFYEGLNRHPDTIFKDKTVSELGCGNGWISIAIAAKWLPSKVPLLTLNLSIWVSQEHVLVLVSSTFDMVTVFSLDIAASNLP